MSPSHLPRDNKDRSVRARKHDPYKAKGKPREPLVCRECKAVYWLESSRSRRSSAPDLKRTRRLA